MAQAFRPPLLCSYELKKTVVLETFSLSAPALASRRFMWPAAFWRA